MDCVPSARTAHGGWPATCLGARLGCPSPEEMKLSLQEMSGTAVLRVAGAAGSLTCQAQLYYGSLFGVSLWGKIDLKFTSNDSIKQAFEGNSRTCAHTWYGIVNEGCRHSNVPSLAPSHADSDYKDCSLRVNPQERIGKGGRQW